MKQNITKTASICTLFNGMTENDTNKVLDSIKYQNVSYASHELYCLYGEQCKYVDIVQKGELVVRAIGMSGRTVEILRIHKGDMIAPCFILASDKRFLVEIEALTQVSVIRMSQNDLFALVKENTDICRNFIQMVSDVATFLTTKIRFLSLMTIKEKLAYYLKFHVAEQRSLHIRLKESRQCIADIFGVQKYSLMRCFSELRAKGIIEISGKEITILNPKML